MRVKFLQSTAFHGVHYKQGTTHDVPDKVIEHPYFGKLAKAGLVIPAESVKQVPVETLEERNKRLGQKMADKIAAQSAKAQAGADAKAQSAKAQAGADAKADEDKASAGADAKADEDKASAGADEDKAPADPVFPDESSDSVDIENEAESKSKKRKR